MAKVCLYCGKQVKGLLLATVKEGGSRYLCDDCVKLYREAVFAQQFAEIPPTWEFTESEMRDILSGNGTELLERSKKMQNEKRQQKQRMKDEKQLQKQKVVCCVCGEKDCSGGKLIQDDYRLCERCASNYVMTAAMAEIGTEFFETHDPDFFRDELSECYNPRPNISFNFKTQKIYLKDALLKKNYKVVSFSDLIGFNAETREEIGTKNLFRVPDADFRYNGTTIRYHIDDSPSMNKNQEFDKVLDCFAKIQNNSNSSTDHGDPVSGNAANNHVNPFQLRCPICGGTNCTPIVETSTSGKDFSAGKGCCGFALLGPIGILCGACGKGKQTTSTAYWMCLNCGNKFRK